jgi:hypothetical protein
MAEEDVIINGLYALGLYQIVILFDHKSRIITSGLSLYFWEQGMLRNLLFPKKLVVSCAFR